jgi:4-carboxymuconolactone decarboxylase
MNLSVDYALFVHQLDEFEPDSDRNARALALYAAAIVTAETDPMTRALVVARKLGVKRSALYEVVLQSYLFLGFPRMLIAAEHLQDIWPEEIEPVEPEAITSEEAEDWFARGSQLYSRVYGDKDQLLKRKVVGMAPEVFRWMLIEGYGKVLSRPELRIAERELCIIAQLMMDDKERQLHSHLRGALNVGVAKTLVRKVVEDLGRAAGNGYETASRLLRQLEID